MASMETASLLIWLQCKSARLRIQALKQASRQLLAGLSPLGDRAADLPLATVTTDKAARAVLPQIPRRGPR
jgi:hypothetical protein